MSSSDKAPEANADIEDGEITDDDEEPIDQEPVPEPAPTEIDPVIAGAQPTIPVIPKSLGNVSDSDSIGASIRDVMDANSREISSDRERSDEKDKFPDEKGKVKGRKRDGKKARDKGNKDKSHRHMTEAEKSILHLRKREKMMREREKWDKHHRKDSDPLDDDFAKNIEKTLATILIKKEKEVAALSAGEEVPKEEEKRGKKRKKEDREKDKLKEKHKRSMDSPRSEIDENEMLNVRSGSPGAEMRLHPSAIVYSPQMEHRRSRSPSRSEESFNSEFSSDEREERSRRRLNKSRKKKERRDRRERRANREEHSKMPLQDAQGVCVFYMQGKCQKNDCPYSHEVSPPMKLELCKFYLMDCCAKGENCSYMHSEFPCKFYHTGLQCTSGKDCKFAHGRPLSEGLKQILFKHIETAPRDILQGFPRLSRDEALNLINQTQKKLTDQLNSGETDQATPTFSASSPTHNNTSTTTQPSYVGAQGNIAGFGMYRDEYGAPDARESNEREKEGAKGGIPSLFDITVPVPRELAQGLDFDAKMSKNDRHKNKNSRWQQDQDSKMGHGYPVKGFTYGTDQDMRISSNGDIDMRTLPAIPSPTRISDKSNSSQGDVDIRPFTKDVDIRLAPFARHMPTSMDMDIRKMTFDDAQNDSDSNSREDQKLSSGRSVASNFELPQATRDLLARITANQKDNTVAVASALESHLQSNVQSESYDDQNINWYSDDDDDDENRLTIKVEDEDNQKKEREDSIESSSEKDQDERSEEATKSSFLSPPQFLSLPQFSSKTADIVGKLGDLSKIDISAEVTKLLTSMSQKKKFSMPSSCAVSSSSDSSKLESGSVSPKDDSVPTDPRVVRQQNRADPRQDPNRQDPRLSTDSRHRGRQNSTESKEKEKKSDKISIYEQGGLDLKKAALEIDRDSFKSSLRPDIDLRNMALPFKGMQNYTPATEIDASIKSHLPMVWNIVAVEIPRPDYTGLKLSINDAEKTGDPRLRKIFRLSVDEKDSPASPKASPKQSTGPRVDPRLRKMEDQPQDPKDSVQNPQLSYTQQVSMLQSSQFYQSLTSNQKLMLNQELARYDQSGGGGSNDPVLNTLLSSLNLLPQVTKSQHQSSIPPNSHIGAAILANVTKMNPLIPNQPLMGQQGLLGAAPGIPNMPPNMPQGMPPDYSMNFDPRGGPGLLGNGPPGPPFGQFGGMDQPPYGGYNEDFYGGYDDQGNMGPQGGNNMGPQGGNFRQGRGYNNNRDGRRRGGRDGFRGGRGNRNFGKRGGGRDKGDRMDRGDRGREGRGNRGHSPS